jgi:hypothetical protein
MFVEPIADEHPSTPDPPQGLVLKLGELAGDALARESDRLGVPIEELASFSVLYYLADVDSGRIARSISSRL